DGDVGALLGVAAASADDVNGDGIDDVIFGAPVADHARRIDNGSAYVVYGRSAIDPVDASQLGPWGFRIDGVGDDDHTGDSVSGVGDWTGDGKPDVLVGAPYADPL